MEYSDAEKARELLRQIKELQELDEEWTEENFYSFMQNMIMRYDEKTGSELDLFCVRIFQLGREYLDRRMGERKKTLQDL